MFHFHRYTSFLNLRFHASIPSGLCLTEKFFEFKGPLWAVFGTVKLIKGFSINVFKYIQATLLLSLKRSHAWAVDG